MANELRVGIIPCYFIVNMRQLQVTIEPIIRHLLDVRFSFALNIPFKILKSSNAIVPKY
jgi:hypothetical protein